MQNKNIERTSTRAFSDVPISATAISLIKSILLKSNPGIFGHVYTIRLIQDDFVKKNHIKKISAYGTITGKPAYIFSVSSHKKYALIDYAYCLENLVIELTDSGIDSIWLGGMYKKRKLKKLFRLKDHDMIPAVIAIGNGKISTKTVSSSVQSSHRLSFGEVFFDQTIGKPLTMDHAGEFADVLEAVRIGPSFKNLQPWTIVQDTDNPTETSSPTSSNTKMVTGVKISTSSRRYHFYIKNHKISDQKHMDIGIALSHFDYMRKAKKLKGHFEILDGLDVPDYEYVATFKVL
jgi:hypothetical protein